MSTMERDTEEREGGDTKLRWNTDDPVETAAAKAHFETLTKPRSEGGGGHLAYRKRNGEREQIREFDPEAERIVLVAPQAGG
jgi:hypothetical protein